MIGTAEWDVGKRADLEALMVRSLGPPDRSRRWCCPICQDHSPRLAYNPRTNRYTCYHGECGRSGDAVDWLVEVEGMPALEAIVYLGGRVEGWDERQARATRSATGRTTKPPPPPLDPSRRAADAPESYRDPAYQAAVDAIICQAERDLWETPEGRSGGLAWLRRRGLADFTIRRFRLGWIGRGFETEPIDVLRDGQGEHGLYVPRGVVFPYIAPGSWFSSNEATPGPRWSGAAVRKLAHGDVFADLPPRPDGKRPNKVLMLPGTPRRSFYPHPEIDPTQGERPAVMTEGETDALLLEQAIGHAAFVGTLGGSGSYPDALAMETLGKCPGVLLAVDYDPAGEASTSRWKTLVPEAIRASPPDFAHDSDKDVADLVACGGDPREWIKAEFEDLGWPWPKDR